MGCSVQYPTSVFTWPTQSYQFLTTWVCYSCIITLDNHLLVLSCGHPSKSLCVYIYIYVYTYSILTWYFLTPRWKIPSTSVAPQPAWRAMELEVLSVQGAKVDQVRDSGDCTLSRETATWNPQWWLFFGWSVWLIRPDFSIHLDPIRWVTSQSCGWPAMKWMFFSLSKLPIHSFTHSLPRLLIDSLFDL